MSVTTDRVATDGAPRVEQQAPPAAPMAFRAPEWPLTAPERRLRLALRLLALVAVVAVPACVVGGVLLDGPQWAQAGLVASAAYAVVLAMLFGLAATNVRRHVPLTQVLIVAHALSALAAGALLVFAGLGSPEILWASLGVDALVAVTLVALYVPARRAQYGRLTYLLPTELEALAAIAEVVLPRDMSIAPLDVARTVDRYMGDFRARRAGT
jgi:hypothetical protein